MFGKLIHLPLISLLVLQCLIDKWLFVIIREWVPFLSDCLWYFSGLHVWKLLPETFLQSIVEVQICTHWFFWLWLIALSCSCHHLLFLVGLWTLRAFLTHISRHFSALHAIFIGPITLRMQLFYLSTVSLLFLNLHIPVLLFLVFS